MKTINKIITVAMFAIALATSPQASAKSALDKAIELKQQTQRSVNNIKERIDTLNTDELTSTVVYQAPAEQTSESADGASDSFDDYNSGSDNGISDLIIPILGIVFGITVPFAAFVLSVYFIARAINGRQRIRYETIARAAEAGHPLPPEFYINDDNKTKNRLQSGIVWIGWGVAMIALTVAGCGSAWWALGLIPIFIGASRIAVYYTGNKASQDDPSAHSAE